MSNPKAALSLKECPLCHTNTPTVVCFSVAGQLVVGIKCHNCNFHILQDRAYVENKTFNNIFKELENEWNNCFTERIKIMRSNWSLATLSSYMCKTCLVRGNFSMHVSMLGDYINYKCNTCGAVYRPDSAKTSNPRMTFSECYHQMNELDEGLAITQAKQENAFKIGTLVELYMPFAYGIKQGTVYRIEYFHNCWVALEPVTPNTAPLTVMRTAIRLALNPFAPGDTVRSLETGKLYNILVLYPEDLVLQALYPDAKENINCLDPFWKYERVGSTIAKTDPVQVEFEKHNELEYEREIEGL